jgi:hypothetical protein
MGVSFEDLFNVLLPVPPFSKAGANFKGVAWCNLDSFGVMWSFVVMMSNSGRRARVRVVS